MDGRRPLTADPAFIKLKEYFEANGANISINNEFKADPDRFSKFRYYAIAAQSNIIRVLDFSDSGMYLTRYSQQLITFIKVIPNQRNSKNKNNPPCHDSAKLAHESVPSNSSLAKIRFLFASIKKSLLCSL